MAEPCPTNWPVIITTIAASVSAFAAVWSVRSQNKRAQFSMGVDLIMKLQDQFSGSRMVAVRHAAAIALLNKADDYDKVDEVLDFFENIGLLSRKKIVDDKFVWHSFSRWIYGYYQAAKGYIDEVQRDRLSTWTDLTNLYQKVVEIERAEEGLSYADWSSDKITEFLQSEASL